jgi:GntR family transcriptional regulator/MocR family aminotransferase
VLNAYEQLRAEGFIDGKVGSGSYVAELPQASPKPEAPATLTNPSRYARRLAEISMALSGPRASSLRYNLEYRQPQTNLALTTAWSRMLARAARYTDPGYPEIRGNPALRQAICDYLARRRGILVDPEDVLVTNGTQQALSLIARVLVDEGDTVAIEDPAYYGAYRALVAHGAKLEAVRTDDEGLVCAELPPHARCVFVTPSHQFPGGSLLSLPRRLALLEFAHAHDAWIIEDDYDGEFRYDVHPLAALRSLDSHGRVIYVNSFSKVLFPSLRLGYLVFPTALRDIFGRAKWIDDFGSSGVEQAALAEFMASGAFERHLKQAAKALRARRSALLEALRVHAGERVETTDSHAGMFVVVWLRDLDHARCEALIARAREVGVGLHPIAQHYVRRPPRPGLLISYAGISTAELVEAVRLFGLCLQEFR